jgi:hypothetical protein
LVAVSFQDGSAAADVAVCARTGTVSSGMDKAGSTAKVESSVRRAIPPEEGTVGFMSVSCIAACTVQADEAVPEFGLIQKATNIRRNDFSLAP